MDNYEQFETLDLNDFNKKLENQGKALNPEDIMNLYYPLQVEGDEGARDFVSQLVDPALCGVESELKGVEVELIVAHDDQFAIDHASFRQLLLERVEDGAPEPPEPPSRRRREPVDGGAANRTAASFSGV